MRHVKWMRIGGIFVIVVFPLFMVTMGFLIGRSPMDTLRANGFLIIGLPLLWAFGIPLMLRWTSSRLWQSTPMFQGDHVYTFGPDGFELVTPVSRTAMAWPSVVKAVETQDFVLLFLSNMAAQFIPKSAFSGPNQLDDFRRLVSGAIGSRAQWSDGATALVAAS